MNAHHTRPEVPASPHGAGVEPAGYVFADVGGLDLDPELVSEIEADRALLAEAGDASATVTVADQVISSADGPCFEHDDSLPDFDGMASSGTGGFPVDSATDLVTNNARAGHRLLTGETTIKALTTESLTIDQRWIVARTYLANTRLRRTQEVNKLESLRRYLALASGFADAKAQREPGSGTMEKTAAKWRRFLERTVAHLSALTHSTGSDMRGPLARAAGSGGGAMLRGPQRAAFALASIVAVGVAIALVTHGDVSDQAAASAASHYGIKRGAGVARAATSPIQQVALRPTSELPLLQEAMPSSPNEVAAVPHEPPEVVVTQARAEVRSNAQGRPFGTPIAAKSKAFTPQATGGAPPLPTAAPVSVVVAELTASLEVEQSGGLPGGQLRGFAPRLSEIAHVPAAGSVPAPELGVPGSRALQQPGAELIDSAVTLAGVPVVSSPLSAETVQRDESRLPQPRAEVGVLAGPVGYLQRAEVERYRERFRRIIAEQQQASLLAASSPARAVAVVPLQTDEATQRNVSLYAQAAASQPAGFTAGGSIVFGSLVAESLGGLAACSTSGNNRKKAADDSRAVASLQSCAIKSPSKVETSPPAKIDQWGMVKTGADTKDASGDRR